MISDFHFIFMGWQKTGKEFTIKNWKSFMFKFDYFPGGEGEVQKALNLKGVFLKFRPGNAGLCVLFSRCCNRRLGPSPDRTAGISGWGVAARVSRCDAGLS